VGEVTGIKQSELPKNEPVGRAPIQEPRHMTNEQLVDRLGEAVEGSDIAKGLRALCDYVGAAAYLMIRQDVNSDNALENVISSNWPFDLVVKSGASLISELSRTTELDKCLSILHPQFAMMPDTAILPAGVSQQYCSVSFNVARSRYCMTFMCPTDFILSQQRLRLTGVYASYLASLLFSEQVKSSRELELTDRELECLYWIAEGKTSDEIATIIGISKNTINNYITSVMRKTATRTRSEAIAYAVRHNLV
jgi:LuxR family transcriptional regulator, regulator of acetate metabolism